MNLGPRDNCRHCGKPIMICPIRGGKRIPFDVEMVEAANAVAETYVPIRIRCAVTLAPVGEMSAHRLEGVRWFAQRHRCAEFFRAKAAAAEHVDSLDVALADVIPLLYPEAS